MGIAGHCVADDLREDGGAAGTGRARGFPSTTNAAPSPITKHALRIKRAAWPWRDRPLRREGLWHWRTRPPPGGDRHSAPAQTMASGQAELDQAIGQSPMAFGAGGTGRWKLPVLVPLRRMRWAVRPAAMLGTIIGHANGLTRSGPPISQQHGPGFPNQSAAHPRRSRCLPHPLGRASLIRQTAWPPPAWQPPTANWQKRIPALASLRSIAALVKVLTSPPPAGMAGSHQTVWDRPRPRYDPCSTFTNIGKWCCLNRCDRAQPCDDNAAETLHHQQPQALPWSLDVLTGITKRW